MRYFLRKGSLLLLAAACFFAMGACDVFLGPQVNTGIPSVNKGDDEMFLQGTNNKRYLDVTQSQGFGIDKVYMEIPYFERGTGVAKTKTIDAKYDNSVSKWYVIIDVSDMEDGQIKTRAIAKDVSGNIGDNKELIYIVKNLPPQIQMTIPSIRGNEFDDKIFMDGLVANDPVFVGFDLMGLATDNYGIPLGWPKIMIWPSSDPVDANGVPTNPKWKVWRTMEVPAARDGLTTTRITWPMLQLIPDAAAEGGYRLPKPGEPRAYLSNGHYRFRIWTKDLFGNDNYYPNRTDNTLGLDADDPAYPIKYIEIDYMVSEIPIARVNEIRRYYNGVDGFTAKVVVTSTNPLERVEVFIADTDSGMSNASARLEIPVSSRLEEKPGDDLYNPSSSTYTYDLDFTDAEMISRFTPWPSPIGNGDLYFHVVAEDVSHKTSPMASREFTYDINAPTVKFRRPFNIESITPPAGLSGSYTESGTHYEIYHPSDSPKWVTGTVTVEGWSEDPTNGIPSSGIAKVYYHIGNLFDDTTGQNHAGRQTIYENPVNWTDTKLDDPFTHADGWSGNLGTWSYTANFNTYKSSPLTSALVQNAADFGFYDSNGVEDITIDVTGTVNRQRFYLPFNVKVVDRAGNIKIIHYKLAIDPDMDIPVVDINYPKEFDPIDGPVGGEVRLSGIATDNEWVHTVLIRIHRADRPAGTYYIPTSYYGGTQFYGSGRDVGFPKPRNAANTADDTAGWFEAYKIGNDMVVGWYYNINGDNGLDPDAGFQTVDVTIEVRAIDSKDGVTTTGSLIGPAEVVHVKFSAGVPTISIPVISGGVGDRDYVDGIRTSVTMKVTTILREDHNAAIGSVKIRFNGSPWTEIIGNNNAINYTNCSAVGATVTRTDSDPTVPVDVARKTSFRIVLNIDTLTYASYGNTSTLKIDLTAADNSTPPLSASGSYTFEIDNYYPTFDEITTQPSASGTGFVVSGRARDYIRDNMIQGLERVLVYFERAIIEYPSGVGPDLPRNVKGTGVFLNPRGFGNTVNRYGDEFYHGKPEYNNAEIKWGSQTTGNGIPPMDTRPNVMDATLPTYNPSSTFIPNVASFPNFPVLKLINKGSLIGSVWESPHAMVIDNQEFGEGSDSDEDGTYGEVWDGMVDKQWQARMNTIPFPDGPLMVHYIVMDQAGNATHYQKPIYIENKKPRIMSINIGTDIDGDGDVAPYGDTEHPGEYRSGFTNVGIDQMPNSKIEYDPAFRVRNNRLAFDLNIDSSTGNGEKHYKVSYVTAGAVKSAGDMNRGSVYTIVSTGTTDWRQCGAPVSAENVTFVASGKGSGSGTVREYDEVAASIVRGDFTGNSVTILKNSFTGITDSPISGGVIETPNDRLFIVKVFDSAVPASQFLVSGSPPATAPEDDQLAHAVLVAMNLENTDRLPPTITAAPFGKKFSGNANNAAKNEINVGSYNDNIVMLGNIRQGYVQYAGAGHSGTVRPDISGRVIFLGKVEDNQLIKNITVTIPGFNGGAAITVAEWKTDVTPHRLVSARPKSGGIGTGNDAWYFEILDEYLTLDYGHVINWEFGWDSSFVTNQVGSPTVTFSVNDFRTNPPVSPLNPGQDTMAVNIVPYISEVVSGLSGAYNAMPSAFARSANGWYPVRENESITLYGFNLGANGTIAATSDRITLNGQGLAATVSDISISDKQIGRTKIVANVGTAANSGALLVTVNSVSSLNNRNSETAGYNEEQNGVNNNILTDDRYLYVWKTGVLHEETSAESPMKSPYMRMDNNSNRFMSYGGSATSSASLYIRKNNTRYVAQTDTNRFLNTIITFDSAGDYYLAASNQTAGTDRTFSVYARPTAASSGTNPNNGNTSRRLLRLDGNPDRVKFPRIAVQNTNGGTTASDTNPTRFLVSYYDADKNNNAVFLHYGTVGANLSATTGFGGDFPAGASTASSTAGIVDTFAAPQTVANNSSTYRGSQYTAVGVLSNGRPVVAWHDGTNQNLVFSYGNSIPADSTSTSTGTNTSNLTGGSTGTTYRHYTFAAGHGFKVGDSVTIGGTSYVVRAVNGNNIHFALNTATTTASQFYTVNTTNLAVVRISYTSSTDLSVWQANARVIPNSAGKGSHVDMVVDSGNNVHLAYYDVNNGGLYYTHIPSASVVSASTSGIQTVRVDTFLAAGTKIMLNVRYQDGQQVPYISYFHVSFGETKNSVRVAWQKDFPLADGTDINDRFTGAWEVMTVPVATTALATEFICNGVPTANTNWTNANGPSTLNGFANIHKSILLGYMTQNYYEGAILKHTLW